MRYFAYKCPCVPARLNDVHVSIYTYTCYAYICQNISTSIHRDAYPCRYTPPQTSARTHLAVYSCSYTPVRIHLSVYTCRYMHPTEPTHLACSFLIDSKSAPLLVSLNSVRRTNAYRILSFRSRIL